MQVKLVNAKGDTLLLPEELAIQGWPDETELPGVEIQGRHGRVVDRWLRRLQPRSIRVAGTIEGLNKDDADSILAMITGFVNKNNPLKMYRHSLASKYMLVDKRSVDHSYHVGHFLGRVFNLSLVFEANDPFFYSDEETVEHIVADTAGSSLRVQAENPGVHQVKYGNTGSASPVWTFYEFLSGKKYAVSAQADDYCELTFSGAGVVLIASKGLGKGIAAVSVDGGAEENADLYAASDVHEQAVWSKTGLIPGEHVLRVRVTGTKNAGATGYDVDVDAFDVIPSTQLAVKNIGSADAAPQVYIQAQDRAYHRSYLGKVAGSITENKNKAWKYSGSGDPAAGDAAYVELSQSEYDKLKLIGDAPLTVETSVQNEKAHVAGLFDLSDVGDGTLTNIETYMRELEERIRFYGQGAVTGAFTPGMAYVTGKFSQGVPVQGRDGNYVGDRLAFSTMQDGSVPSGQKADRINLYQGTISLWFRPESNGNDNLNHFFFDTGYFQVYKTASNRLEFAIYDGSWHQNAYVNVSGVIVAGNWYHAVARWSVNKIDGTNYADVRMNNGTSGVEPTAIGNITKTATGYIGSFNDGKYSANAIIDDFAIWQRVLTDAELADLFDSGTGRTADYVGDPDLLAYYTLDGSGKLTDGLNSGVGSGIRQQLVKSTTGDSSGTSIALTGADTHGWAAGDEVMIVGDGKSDRSTIAGGGVSGAGLTLTSSILGTYPSGSKVYKTKRADGLPVNRFGDGDAENTLLGAWPDVLAVGKRDELWHLNETLNSTKGVAGTFARASVAYKQDGSQVGSGAPRYEAGQFGQAILVEAATTNLLSANQSSVETDTTGFAAIAGAAISRDLVEFWSGAASLKTITPNAAAGEGFETTSVPVSNNYSHTASVYLKGAGTVKLGLAEYTNADALVGVTESAVITLTGAWVRYSVTRAFGATGEKARLQVITDVQQGITFYADGLQIERKPYASRSWQIGGTARVLETLFLPIPAGVTPDSGTFEVWAYMDAHTKRDVSGQYNRLFVIPRSIGDYAIDLYHSGTTWSLRTKDNSGGVTETTFSNSYTPDGWRHFACKWSRTQLKLLVDGVVRLTISSPKLPSAFGASVCIGSDDQTHHLDTYHDEVRITPYTKTDAEIAASYALSAPYYDPTTGESSPIALRHSKDTSSVLSDLRSLKLVAGTANDNIYQDFDVTGEENYVFRAKVKTDATATAKVRLFTQSAILAEISVAANTTQIVEAALRIPKQDSRLWLQVVGEINGASIWVDDVVLLKNLVANPGFEERTLHQGTAQAGGANTITLSAYASAVDNYYNGYIIELAGGTGSGQARKITAYNGTTKVATVDADWGTQPDGTSTYQVGTYFYGGVGWGWTKIGTPTLAESNDGHSGSKSQSMTNSAASNAGIAGTIALQSGQYCLISGWTKRTAGAGTPAINVFGYGLSDKSLPTGASWTKFSVIFKATATGSASLACWNSAADTTILWDDVSIIELDSLDLTATPATEANSYEPGKWNEGILVGYGDRLTFPASGGVVSAAAGTVIFWFKPRWKAIDTLPVTTPYLFDLTVDANNRYSLSFDQATDALVFTKRVAGNSKTASSGALVFALGDLVHIAISWGAAGIKIYYAGVPKASDPDTTPLGSLPDAFDLGGLNDPLYSANGVFDALQVFNVQLTDQQVADEFARATAPPLQDSQTLLAQFDTSLALAGPDAISTGADLQIWNPDTSAWVTVASNEYGSPQEVVWTYVSADLAKWIDDALKAVYWRVRSQEPSNGDIPSGVYVDWVEFAAKHCHLKNPSITHRGRNLAKSPGFEDGTSSPDDWTATGTPTWEQVELYDGDRAVKVNKDNYYLQSIPITPGAFYCFSAFIEAVAAGSFDCLRVDWFDAGNNLISSTTVSRALTTEYARYERTIQAPGNALIAKILAYTTSSTYTYWDNVQFELVEISGGTASEYSDAPERVIAITSELDYDDVVRLDALKILAEKNGDSIFSAVSTEYRVNGLNLQPGMNNLKFGDASGSDKLWKVILRYKPKWY